MPLHYETATSSPMNVVFNGKDVDLVLFNGTQVLLPLTSFHGLYMSAGSIVYAHWQYDLDASDNVSNMAKVSPYGTSWATPDSIVSEDGYYQLAFTMQPYGANGEALAQSQDMYNYIKANSSFSFLRFFNATGSITATCIDVDGFGMGNIQFVDSIIWDGSVLKYILRPYSSSVDVYEIDQLKYVSNSGGLVLNGVTLK